MAHGRSLSLDALAIRPNPFWSGTARANWELRRARPADLPGSDVDGNESELPPIPGGDVDPDLASGRGRSPIGTLEDRTGSGEATSMERRLTRTFETPASWTSSTGNGKGRAAKEGARTQGEMPISENVPESGKDVRNLLQEEGERQMKRARGSLDARVQDDLERAMERELLMQIQEENLRLKAELEAVQKEGQQSTEWSEISAGDPQRPTNSSLERARYTPNGTKVPDDPPPTHVEDSGQWQVPPWPLEAYEVQEIKAPCWNVFSHGYRPRAPGPSGGLHHQECGGGTRSRQELCDGERVEPFPPPPEWSMRMEWELMRLRQRLDEQERGPAMRESPYWGQPFQPMQSQGPPPWDRGTSGEVRGDGDGRYGCDRAGTSGEVRGDGDGRHGGDRACTSGEVRGDADGRYGRDRAWQDGGQGGDGHEVKDNMKSVNITLPVLPPHTGKESGLACGDWLVQVRQLMGDLTAGSLEWWDALVNSVMRRYNEWLIASPLERLHLQPPDEAEYNNTTARKRMDLRASVLLMSSVPQGLREELIAGRHLESGPILYRILRSYQPGGLAEKSETLQALTGVSASKSPKEAMERLQKWRRHQLRAVELHATLPDPSILCRALAGIVSEVLGQAPQASFRVNSFRLQSRLDVLPTMDNVESYFQMLMAEMETLSLAPEGTNGTPAVKALQSVPPPAGGGHRCKNWGTDTGCRYGRLCRFDHPPLSDAASRCWHCSSTLHRKHECPHYKSSTPAAGSQTGGSEEGKGGKQAHGGGGGKGAKGKSKKGKGAAGAAVNGAHAGSKGEEKGSGSGAVVNKMQSEAGDKGKGGSEVETKGGDQVEQAKQEASSTGGSGDTSTLVSEVTSLLRSLRVGSGVPQLNAFSLKRIDSRSTRPPCWTVGQLIVYGR